MHRKANRRVLRSDLCACGSGRRAKHCHAAAARRTKLDQELLHGDTWAIFVDDTDVALGIPDMKHVPPGTQTWCALVIPSAYVDVFLCTAAAITDKYKTRWSVDALHFTDLISGNGCFKGLEIPGDEKVDCIREVVDGIVDSKAQIWQQSGYAARVRELAERGEPSWLAPQLRKHDVKDQALGWLLQMVDLDLRTRNVSQARVLVEQHGQRRAGTTLSSPTFSTFVGGHAELHDKSVPGLQFADLCAYSYSRTMRSLRSEISEFQVGLFVQLNRLSPLRTSIDMTWSAHETSPSGDKFSIRATPVRRVVSGRVLRPGDAGWGA